MKRWLLRVSVVLCALAVLVVAPWLGWRLRRSMNFGASCLDDR